MIATSYGRRVIFTDAKEITKSNIAEEVRKAYLTHELNRAEITKLYDYYRGKTAILGKEKEVRDNINHRINENRAYEIVKFHKGYVFGEPIQYVRRENTADKTDDDKIASDINALNGYMSDANKAASDNSLAEWMYIAGTGYRLTLPNKAWKKRSDEAPFRIKTLDPRSTFVVYSNDVDQKEMFSVCCVERENNEKVFSGYTDEFYFEFSEHDHRPKIKKHTLFGNPIIEYPAENSRLGVFEIVMSQLDALDELQSNRMDDIVQFVNSFLAILGGELDEATYKKLEEWKTLCLPQGTDAKYLSPAMSQQDVQTLKDDICQAILTICGVPNRNGGSSTSDTGSAVILRDGWEDAEARAKDIEEMFKCSEKRFLKLVLHILRINTKVNLRLSDVVPHFTRRNYQNIAAKSQVLIALLNSPWVHPEVAYAHCGMFPDPESAYLQGKAWYEQNNKKQEVEDNGNQTN